MKDKKNIDQLFKDGFKNFEATPSARVWENIQTELKKEKRNRKPIPLWIKYGGIAALLALMVTLGNLVFNPLESPSNSVTDDKVVEVDKEINHENSKNSYQTTETQIATEDIKEVINQKTDGASNKALPNKKEVLPTEQSAKVLIASDNINAKSKSQNLQTKNVLKEKNHNYDSEDRIAVVNRSSEKNETSKNYKYATENVVKNGKVIADSEGQRILALDKPILSEKDQSPNGDIKESDAKKSILEAIAEDEKSNKKALDTKNQKPEHRWNITPNVAPVYYSSLGNGSSIDPDFSNNPQKGDVNMSFGLQVSYALNDRLSVRTGVNNVDLSYSTADILIGTGPVSMGLRSVDYGNNQMVVTAINRSSLNQGGTLTNGFGDVTLKSSGSDARLIQNINYFEVPLELKYALINNKFGVNVIGGVSTLFLGNNKISVTSENFSSVLGAANNLTDVSFSTNVGLGLDYKLSKRFILNVEPMFKYQLNPYTDSAVNFKPYYLGVYSGLSFKF